MPFKGAAITLEFLSFSTVDSIIFFFSWWEGGQEGQGWGTHRGEDIKKPEKEVEDKVVEKKHWF